MRALIIVATLLFTGGIISLAYAAPNKIEYELRDRCGKEAKDFWQTYHKENRVIASAHGRETISNYRNHYNATLNKCFLLEITTTVGGTVADTERLFDVNENGNYGVFAKDNADRVIVCRVKGSKNECSSEYEWRKLITPFMQDATN